MKAPRPDRKPRRRRFAALGLFVAGLFLAGGKTAQLARQAEEAARKREEEKQKTRRKGKLAFALFVLGALVVVGCGIWAAGWDYVLADRQNPETDNAYANGDYTTLTARVDGYVSRMLVNDNQQVKAGDVLMVIEDDNYRALVRQGEASVTAAEAAVAALGNQVDALRQQVAQADRVAQGTQAQRIFAAQEATRQNIILPSDLGLLRTTQQADAQSRALAAQVRQASSVAEERRRQLDVAVAQQARAAAQVEVLRAQLELARINLGYTRIRAPRDGVVGARQVRVGDLARPGQPVISLVPLTNVWVTANFNERQMMHIRLGQRARLRFDAYPDAVLNGHVVGIEPLTGQQQSLLPPDNTTGNYTKVVQRVPVKITIDEQASSPVWGLIRPGLSVLARVQTQGNADVRTAR